MTLENKTEVLIESIQSEIVSLKIAQAVTSERLETLTKTVDVASAKIFDMHQHMIGIVSKISPFKKTSNGWVAQVMMLILAALIGGSTSAVFAHVTAPTQVTTTQGQP